MKKKGDIEVITSLEEVSEKDRSRFDKLLTKIR